MAALACYAFVAALFILFWPAGSTPRYYLPMVLPLCVFGGLGYDQLSARRPQIVAPILVLTAGLLVYALAYALASPLLPQQFRQAQVEAARVTALVRGRARPDLLVRRRGAQHPALSAAAKFEMHARRAGAVPGPAWMIMTTADAEALLARRPEQAARGDAARRSGTVAAGAARSVRSSSLRFPGISRRAVWQTGRVLTMFGGKS